MADYSETDASQVVDRHVNIDVPEELQNRGADTKTEPGDQPQISVTLLNIDETIINYLNERIRPITTQDDKFVKVPIVYGNPERWKSVQTDGVLRDNRGKVQLPIMMLHRTSVKKNTDKTSPINKYLEREFETGWNKYNPYDRFAVLNNIVPVRQRLSTVTPDYFDLVYECMIWTEYTEQMNQLIQQISFEDDEFWGDRGKFKFRTRIDEYKMETKLPADENRLVRTTFSMEVSAYLIPERMIDKYGKLMKTSQQRFTVKKMVKFIEVDT
jgi:hypothetical protein